MALFTFSGAVSAESYYKETPIFSTAPDPTKSLATVDRFGPVGMGLELIQPNFTMRIKNIEEGSPAAATGKLQKGQIIESINGERLADIDPRIQLAQMITKAEASDGVLKFMVKDKPDAAAQEVIVKIPVLGAYSDTWPLNCPKSDKIVRNFAEHLKKPDSDKGFAGIGMLFLMSTGDDSDLPTVREWALNTPAPKYAWHIGYGGIGLCEYYLRTGDQEVLPNIQKWVDNAVQGQYMDGWAGRSGTPRVTYGNGHLNAAGTGVVTFLMLAKECGADVPDHALLGALRHFYRYAGRGGNPYGDNRPERGFVDNGKNGLLAFAMAGAASLTPDGEDSVYAAARDACAMNSFYTTSFMLHGHTGGGIGEIWRSTSMGLLHEKKPNQYRDFMDKRQWSYELSRRWNGTFGILGGAGYDKEEWGAGYAWTYTVPRKTLRVTGAPRTKYSKPYQLPKQPWGTKADNEFLSLKAVPFPDGTVQDLSKETLAEDSSKPFLIRLHKSGEVSDDMIRRYVHHQDAIIRFTAASKALGINSGYIGWREPGGELRKELVMEFLNSKSARVRRAMLCAIHVNLTKEKNTSILTPEVFDIVVKAIADPEESWWVKDAALQIVGEAPADWVEPHLEMILPFLEHEEWWFRNAALVALTPVVADERCYKKVIPAIGDLVKNNQRSAVTLGLLGGIREKIKEGSDEVKQLATEVLKETYTGYAGLKTAEGGLDLSSVYDQHLEYIAQSLAEVPGGLDVLYEISTERFPNQILPYKDFFLNADPDQFSRGLRDALKPIIMDELIPAYVGKNRTKLEKLVKVTDQNTFPGGPNDTIDGLTALYERAGIDDYSWKMYANIRTSEWSYHSFDPIASEQVPYDQLITRFREVTMPKGMENWFDPGFSPSSAGWKTGKAPFGQYNGKLPDPPVSKCTEKCTGPICFGATPVNTLWEKEVLLLRGTFDIPPLKKDHRYRIQINGGDHVGMGGGYAIYINGKELIVNDSCTGRGGGEKPKGAFITSDFYDEFKDGRVTIAVKSFLRYNDKYKVKPTEKTPQGRISLHLEEMKFPPMGDDLVLKSASVVPMTSSEWQELQFEERMDLTPTDGMFIWNGKVDPNPNVLGSWKVIAEVKTIAEFDPKQKYNPHRAPLASATFNKDGTIDSPYWLWSGDYLMDLTKYQALKMKMHKVDGNEYLCIESGGFGTRNKPGWQTSWMILQRQ